MSYFDSMREECSRLMNRGEQNQQDLHRVIRSMLSAINRMECDLDDKDKQIQALTAEKDAMYSAIPRVCETCSWSKGPMGKRGCPAWEQRNSPMMEGDVYTPCIWSRHWVASETDWGCSK